MKIALYGGSFNPPHISHIFAVTYISMIGGFDKVIVYPCFCSPTGKKLIDFKHRLKMCEISMSHLSNVEISDVEKNLPEPSFTINTVNYFNAMYPESIFRLIVGSDIIQNQQLWKKEHLEGIAKIAPMLVLGRSGFENESYSDIVMPNVSSSNIRKLFLDKNIEEISKTVPLSIIKYIQDNHLYE